MVSYLVVQHSDAGVLQNELQRWKHSRSIAIVICILHKLQHKVGVLGVELLRQPLQCSPDALILSVPQQAAGCIQLNPNAKLLPPDRLYDCHALLCVVVARGSSIRSTGCSGICLHWAELVIAAAKFQLA